MPSPEKSLNNTFIACSECDFLHRVIPLEIGGKAFCTRCGAFLYQNIPNTIDRALALYLSALMLFIGANTFPFISLELSGRMEVNYYFTGILALYRLGMGEVGTLVLVTSILFPFLTITGMLYLLIPLKFGYSPYKMPLIYRMVKELLPWSLVAVFMLGVLISLVKLLDLAMIIPGVSLYSFIGLIVMLTAAQTNLDPTALWAEVPFDIKAHKTGETAANWNLVNCHTCNLLVPQKKEDGTIVNDCPRCQTSLHSRKTNSIARTWALLVSGAILFIPANIYPVMTVIQFGKGNPSTIIGGVIHLAEGGMWVLAFIIFFASIVVPVLKLAVLSFLLISVQNKSSWRLKDRTLLFRITEIVGSWSMVDIYVVAILVGLVNLGALSTITPGIGVSFFGAVVVITMFAAHSFDPRLIWDSSES